MSEPARDITAVLRARARVLARRPAADLAPAAQLEVLEFALARERYALETRHVQEVQPLRDLTALPGTPAFIAGIVNVRGRILPVLDLRRFFDLPDHGLADLHHIVVVRGNDMELGLLADLVVSVQCLDTDSLQPSLPTLQGLRADYLRGVTPQHMVVLDIDRMLADPRIIVNDVESQT